MEIFAILQQITFLGICERKLVKNFKNYIFFNNKLHSYEFTKIANIHATL